MEAADPTHTIPPEHSTLSVRELIRLLLRTWPYLKSQLRHIVSWVGLVMLMEIIWVFAFLVAFDLLNNKILVGQKLEPAQATLLFLDDSYTADPELLAQLVTDVPDEEQAPPEAETAQATPAELLLEPEQRKTVRNRLGVLFAIGALLMLMIAPGVRVYGTWITQRINQSLRSRMIERAEHLSLRYHSHARTGDAIYRVYQDSAMVTAIIDTIILRPVIALGQMLFSFLVICMFSLVLGAVYLAAIIPVIWLLKVYMPKLQTRSRSARETNSALTSRIQEVFGAIRVIKSNRAEEIIEQRFDEDSTAALNAAFAFRVEFILMATFTMMIAGAAIITAQYLMAGWTLAEQSTAFVGAVALVGFTVWNLGAFQSAATRGTDLTGNGRDMIHVWGMLQDMSVGLDRAFFLLELEPEIVDREDAISLPTPINHIRYENVSFGYLPNMPVLRDVTLRANVGTVTAIVGATGSGKSTLMSLLLRLYETDAGIISINDTHLSSIQLDSLRRGVAIALQQNTLFASSVADNIAYAFADASRADVEAAAKVACAHEFIQQMPQGYDTELGERGGDLSTGERQRLSIARAVIRDTPILVLDEPTASLDAETEVAMLENLSNWASERIVFLITHRLSTIRSADQIAFLEDGVIREAGPHDTLMAMEQGRYRAFVLAESAPKAATDEGSVR